MYYIYLSKKGKKIREHLLDTIDQDADEISIGDYVMMRLETDSRRQAERVVEIVRSMGGRGHIEERA